MKDAVAQALDDLVAANRILAAEGVLDGFGHLSVRHPGNPDAFLITTVRAAELVSAEDIVELDMAGDPPAGEQRRLFAERILHAAVYRLRADVNAVCHHHAPAVLPFCITGEPLVPVVHLGATMGATVPFWDSREHFGDTDLLIVTQSPTLSDIHSFHVVLAQSGLMKWASTPYSYLAMTKPSPYSQESARQQLLVSERKYAFIYPMEKKREWYGLDREERGRIMRGHIETGRGYPQITINTAYSFGIDDQEFVVSFECDDPGDFLDLVQELRATESSAWTLRDIPIFTCVAMSVGQALDALDGAATSRSAPALV